MKLLHFDDFKLGVLKGDAVVDVSAEVKDIAHSGPGDLMNGLIEHWGSYKSRIEAAVAEVRPAVETLHKFCQVAMMTLSACVLSACPKVS